MNFNKSNIVTSFIHSSQELYNILLFEIAIYWAEQGQYVLFISPEKFTSLPIGWNKIPDKEVLKFITFLYLSSPKEFSEKLHSLHTWHRTPKVILASNLDSIVQNLQTNVDNVPQVLSFLCALLIDCLQYCSEKIENSKTYLFATVSRELSKNKFSSTLKLYFSNFYDVTDVNFDEVKSEIMASFES